ncbi:MAG TPA: hypothetical protein VER98_09645 [Terriglobia bacterium]|nr:hypothetical protein [Terriglobia bacterium]
MGVVLGDVFLQRGTARPAVSRPVQSEVQMPLLPFAEAQPTSTVQPEAAAPLQDADDRAKLLKLFKVNGDTIELFDNRLKAKNRADYLRRLTYLFLYAHECHGRPSTAFEELSKTLRKAKIWDRNGNARTWLAKNIGFARDENERLTLNRPGREDAQKALLEALDPKIEDEWNPHRNSPRAYRKKA